MKQIEIKTLTGKIRVKTGLHIGVGNDEVHIGGVDSPILRNPINLEPYIPGSSIKGKMRSLIEWESGKLIKSNPEKKSGEVCDCCEEDCIVCRVFGAANNPNKKELAKKRGPTRLIVRDAFLSTKSKKLFDSNKNIIEEKAENSINRITAVANPRFLERVVPGVEFDFEISYRVIDTGDGGKVDRENFEKVVLKALSMLENDYLGGGGSRGNGQIEFIELKDEKGKEVTL